MTFCLKNTPVLKDHILYYIIDEFSFITEPYENSLFYFDIYINKLCLSVDENNKIFSIGGFCGFREFIKSNLELPASLESEIFLKDKFEPGISYSISDFDFDMFIDIGKEWVCIGDPQKKGHAVEFIPNCIMVIDDKGQFVSLWLKPLVCTSWEKVFEENN